MSLTYEDIDKCKENILKSLNVTSYQDINTEILQNYVNQLCTTCISKLKWRYVTVCLNFFLCDDDALLVSVNLNQNKIEYLKFIKNIEHKELCLDYNYYVYIKYDTENINKFLTDLSNDNVQYVAWREGSNEDCDIQQKHLLEAPYGSVARYFQPLSGKNRFIY